MSEAELVAAVEGRSPDGAARLPWATAAEFAARTPEAVEWDVLGIAARRSITEVVAYIKTGKSTLIGHLVRSVLSGRPFLGLPTRRCGVLWVTEERSATFRRLLERCGLLDAVGLHILLLEDIRDIEWPDRVKDMGRKARQVGSGLAVLDTISRLANLGGEGENAAGEAMTAMAPVEELAAGGLSVIIGRHSRKASKAGGDPDSAGRGSGAWSGVSDIVIQIAGAGASHPATVRIVNSVSRFEETPDKALIELKDGEYRLLGDAGAVAAAQAEALIRQALSDGEQFQADLIRLTDAAGKTLGEGTVRRALDNLAHFRKAEKLGRGGRGDPFRWKLLGDNSATPPSPVALSSRVEVEAVGAAITAPRPYTEGGALNFGAVLGDDLLDLENLAANYPHDLEEAD
ncbi:MAG TPA: AAA family ATPase [Candidatus Dormibacteraeota bacterium]|nr:AAA family ATPase [Candidatus Dormibacteraeota bacterium]